MKKGFILYKDNYEPIQNLSVTEKAELLDAIFEYNISGKTKKLSTKVAITFGFLRPQFDRDIEKYEKICEKNRENVERRWVKQGLKNPDSKAKKDNTTVYDRIRVIPSDTSHTHSHTDTDTDKDSHTDTDTRKRGAFAPPSLDQVKDYCLKRFNNVDPANFINFYQSKNWMIGKNKMRDWQAAVRTWEHREKENNGKGVNGNDTKLDRTIASAREYLETTNNDSVNANISVKGNTVDFSSF